MASTDYSPKDVGQERSDADARDESDAAAMDAAVAEVLDFLDGRSEKVREAVSADAL